MRLGLPFRRFSLLFLLASLAAQAKPARAQNENWISPTPAELAMKSEPKAPGAPAIILSYSEADDANSAEVSVRVRVKILTEGGLSAGTVNVPDRTMRNNRYWAGGEFFGRTIHPDGSIALFEGTPQDSATVDSFYGTRKVMSLPAVTVGSILEYGYHFRPLPRAQASYMGPALLGYYAPIWRVQQRYFARSMSFSLRAPEMDGSLGGGFLPRKMEADDVRWVANLPPGAKVVRARNSFTLNVEDIPAPALEEFMPPPISSFYNVRFFYYDLKQEEFWGETGGRVDSFWNSFALPTALLKNAAQSLVLRGDNDATKLRKLYLAVQGLDNTDLSREHSEHEERAEGEKVDRNADTVWMNKRGNSHELAMLFVALARAAGYTAYPMAIASRDHAVFDPSVLSWDQMDATVAIVNLNGREIFFDPGTRMCPFARMAPEHANVMGVSAEAKLVKIRATPAADYANHLTERTAELNLLPDGRVSGRVTIVWAGDAGLAMRLEALRQDARAVQIVAERELQELVPAGVFVKLASLTGLKDSDAPLKATFSVSGKLGAVTGKRLILSAQFFAASDRRILAPETRAMPVLFPSKYLVRDRAVVVLPPELSVEALPKEHNAHLERDASYQAQVQSGENVHDQTLLVVQRTLLLNRVDYKPDEYTGLHKYFGEVASGDAEQIVLKTAGTTATTPESGAK